MHEEHSFYPLLIVVLIAFITPLILSRFKHVRIPVVVGEIIAGMIFGQSGFGLIQPDLWLEVLSTLGFAYLMFLSGLEIDVSALGAAAPSNGNKKSLIKNPTVAGALMFLLTLVAASAAGYGLTVAELARDPWIMALILSTTSLGIVVPVLKERDLLRQSYGQAILIASLIADFVTMLAISFYVVIRTSGFSLDLLLVLVLLGAGMAAYRVAMVVRHRKSGRLMSGVAHATAQVPARGALTLAFVFIALSESLGVEVILGAFIAGAIVALLAEGEGDDLVHKLDAFGYAFFVPIFFINVGATFDLQALLSNSATLLLVPLLLVVAYAVKMLPALVFVSSYGMRGSLALGMLTSSRLSLIIAASAIGLEIGAITTATNAAIVLVAIVTCTVSPLLFARMAPPTAPKREGVLVVGDSTEAQMLTRQLSARGTPVQQFTAQEFQNVDLKEHGGETAQALAALTSDDQTNLAICRAAQEAGVPMMVAHVQSVQYDAAFHSLGAHPINPALATVAMFEGLLTHPTALSLLTERSDSMSITEVIVGNPSLNRQLLLEIDLPHDALIVMIGRGSDRLIARGDSRLATGDIVTLVGSPFALEQAQQLMRE